MIAEEEKRAYKTYRTSETEQSLFTELARKRHSSIAAIVVARTQKEIEKVNRANNAQEALKVDGRTLRPTTNFSFRISDEMDAKIAAIAEAKRMSKTELIHRWLWEELEEDGIAVLTKPVERRIPRGSKVKAQSTRKPGRPRNVEEVEQGQELPKAHSPLISQTVVKHRRSAKR